MPTMRSEVKIRVSLARASGETVELDEWFVVGNTVWVPVNKFVKVGIKLAGIRHDIWENLIDPRPESVQVDKTLRADKAL